jgi:5'-3' exonuclease
MGIKVPRKYDMLVKFLKETIANPSISHRVRFAAAERLDNLYSRHEMYEQQAQRRQEREAKAGAVQGQGEPVEAAETRQQPADEKMENQRIQDVWDSIMSKGRMTKANAE